MSDLPSSSKRGRPPKKPHPGGRPKGAEAPKTPAERFQRYMDKKTDAEYEEYLEKKRREKKVRREKIRQQKEDEKPKETAEERYLKWARRCFGVSSNWKYLENVKINGNFYNGAMGKLSLQVVNPNVVNVFVVLKEANDYARYRDMPAELAHIEYSKAECVKISKFGLSVLLRNDNVRFRCLAAYEKADWYEVVAFQRFPGLMKPPKEPTKILRDPF